MAAPPGDAPKRLSQAVVAAAERERRQIGQGLHDTVCQSLGGITLMVKVLARRLEAGHVVRPAELEELAVMIDRALEEARILSRKLLEEA